MWTRDLGVRVLPARVAAALLAAALPAQAEPAEAAVAVPGRLVVERASHQAALPDGTPLRVVVVEAAVRRDGSAVRPGYGELFAALHRPATATADVGGAFELSLLPGAYALFAYADVDGDGAWDPQDAEPSGWWSRAPARRPEPFCVAVDGWRADPNGVASEAGLHVVLRAPTLWERRDRVVDHGALRWIKGYPVLQLWGTPEQRGVAHGRLAAAQIVDFFRCYMLESKLDVAAYRQFAKFLDSHFAWDPAMMAEVDGVLEGMRASGVDMLVPELRQDFGRTELLAINAYIETRAMRSSCTQFAAWGARTTGTDVAGGSIAGRNMDGELDIRRVTVSHFLLMAVDPAEPGPGGAPSKRFVSMMWPGFVGTISGFNEAGFHCMENAGGTGPGPVVGGLQPISWTMRQALATLGRGDGPDAFEAVLAAHANAVGGSCGAGCIILCAMPSLARGAEPDISAPAWFVEGDRFGHAVRRAGDVAPFVAGAILGSNHHLVYGADPELPGTYFGRSPGFSSTWRYEAGRHKLEAWDRAGRGIGTLDMRELLQTVAHGTTEYAVITRPDALEFDVAVASMGIEPWDAPYREWTTFRFDEVFAGRPGGGGGR